MKTDIKTYCEQLQEELKTQLETISLDNPEPISKVSKCIVVVTATITKVKNFVHTYSFQNISEEISFFKEVKPPLMSQYYYYERLFSIKLNEPFEHQELLLAYYRDQLSELHATIQANAEFYKYCLSGSTELDDKYFVRREDNLKSPEMDSGFSTGYDNILARILAFQLLRDYLLKLIDNLNHDSRQNATLKWTGTKSSLIELIYALQGTETINNGAADIKQIADSFERLFDISLGNYYRQFQEIRLRKNGRTTFLDLMKDRFLNRVDELDEK